MIKGLPNLYSFLHLTQTGLNKILDKIDKYYKPKREPKKKYGEYQRDNRGRIKYRDLLVPIYPLKLAQQRINDLLQNIDLPDYMFGSIPKRNHIINAQQHLNQTHFLTIDLKKFFPNINHFQVHEKIHYRINRCEITGLIVNGNKLQLMPEMTEKARTNIHLKAYVNLVKKYNHQQKN